MPSQKLTFIVSIICFCYFTIYLSIVLFAIDTRPPVLVGVMHEFLTLPMFVFGLVFFVISARGVIREKFSIRSVNFYSFILLLLTIIYLLWLTFQPEP